MTPFRWKRGRLTADFEPHEAGLLRQVVSDVQDLLRGANSDGEPGDSAAGDSGGFGVNHQSEDETAGAQSVRARLLPDGNRSDPALAEDYRALTEDGLVLEKLADAARLLDTVSQDGGRVEIDEPAAEAWLRTINDVRLAIGVRLDVQQGDDPALRAEATGDPRWAAYSWLTAVQGLLVEALASESR